MENKILEFTIAQIIAMFFLFSFLGWILEVSFAAFKHKRFVNRGFLNGPLCPIYGVGGIVIIVILTPLSGIGLITTITPGWGWLTVFLLGIIATSALEFVTGFLLEKIFKRKWWDYSKSRYNIMGYVDLKFSAAWGLLSVVAVYLLGPFAMKIIKPIASNTLNITVWSLSGVFFVDLLITSIALSTINHKLQKQLTETNLIKISSNLIGSVVTFGALRTLKFFSWLERRILSSHPNLLDKEFKFLGSNGRHKPRQDDKDGQ